MSGVRITCDNLRCVRGDRLLFDRLSFVVEPGGALVLRGPNGSGKTSLLRLLAGFLKPDSGKLHIGDAAPQDRIADIHFAGHKDGLKAQLTVREQLATWIRLLEGTGNVDEALACWGLARVADLPCGVLSAGQSRRLALARLYAVRRHVWLLDEPTAPLDAQSVQVFLDAVAAHRAGGGSVVIAAHGALDIPGATELRLGEAVTA